MKLDHCPRLTYGILLVLEWRDDAGSLCLEFESVAGPRNVYVFVFLSCKAYTYTCLTVLHLHIAPAVTVVPPN